MPTPVRIESKEGYKAQVTSRGQLIMAPLDFDDVVFKELDVANTAYNFYSASINQRFVITGIRIKADRDVSNTVDATIIIYEASSATTTTIDKTLYEDALIRGESVTLLPINILVNEGKFINAKTTDDDFYVTIMGYYITA